MNTAFSQGPPGSGGPKRPFVLGPEFWIALALLAGIFLFIFSPHFYVDRDTIFAFQTYFTFYNHYILHGETPRWLPYGSFGIQADYQRLSFMTAMTWVSFLAGKLFHIKNTLTVFKLDVFLQYVVMLSGTGFLVRKILRHAAARLLVLAAMAASMVWYMQLIWNFRNTALLPWQFFFLLQYAQQKQLRWLFLAASVFVFAQLGVPPYFSILHVLLLLLFLAGLGPMQFLDPRRILRVEKPDWLAIVFFAAAAGCFLYFGMHLFDRVQVLFANRDPETNAVPLEQFLTAGTGIGIDKFAGLWLARYAGQDSTMYLGLLPLVFVFYALLFARGPHVRAFGIVSVFLVLLSLGKTTPVAQWTYELFWPMRFFRYIGNMQGWLRPFLILLAGLGLERFLCDGPASAVSRKRLFVCALLSLGTGVVLYLRQRPDGPYAEQWPGFFLWAMGLTGAGILAVVFWKRAAFRAYWIFCAVLLLDLAAYQHLLTSTWPLRFSWLDASVTGVAPAVYQPQRDSLINSGDPRVQRAARLTECCKYGLGMEAHGFLQFDPCVPRNYLTFEWNQDIVEMINERFPLLFTGRSLTEFMQSPGIGVYASLAGCSAAKIRFSGAAVPVADRSAALQAFRSMERPDLLPVLEKVPAGILRQWTPREIPETAALEVTGFTYNRVEVSVRNIPEGGLWLLYSDAWHPGWKARVDGTPSPVIRANLAFKAVYVPEGSGQVVMQFHNGLQELSGTLLYILGGLLMGFLLLLTLAGLKNGWRDLSKTPGPDDGKENR